MALLRTRGAKAGRACPECGSETPTPARFCGTCGARIAGITRPDPDDATIPPAGRALPPEERPSSGRARRAALALLALLTVVAAVVVSTRPDGVQITADEGRTHRGPGRTGVTSLDAVVPTRVAWRWAPQEQGRPAFGDQRHVSVLHAEQVGEVLLLDVDGVAHAVDPSDGTVHWRAEMWGTGFTTVNDTLLVHSGGRLAHIDVATGDLVAATPTTLNGYGPQRVHAHGGVAVLQSADNSIHGVDVQTGASRWVMQDAWLQFEADSVALLVEHLQGRQVAIDVPTGDELWSLDDPIGWAIAVGDGIGVRKRMFSGTEAFDLRTGEVRWTADQPDLGTDPIRVEPGRVGVWSLASTATRDPRLVVYDTTTGDEIERIDLPELGRRSIVVTESGIVGRDGVELFLWREGRKVWTVETTIDDQGEDAPVQVVDDLIVYGGSDGVHARSLATGEERWIAPTVTHRRFVWGAGPLTAGDDLLVVPGVEGRTGTALDRRTGLRVWTAPNLEPQLGMGWGVLSLHDGSLRRLQLDGDIQWRKSADGTQYVDPVRVGEDRIVVTSFESGNTIDEHVRVVQLVDLNDGETLDRLAGRSGFVEAVQGSVVYLVDPSEGRLSRLDVVDDRLTLAWDRADVSADIDVLATPTDLVLLDGSGAAVLDPGTGEERRRIDFDRFMAHPEAVLHGTMLLVPDGASSVNAWDVRTGDHRWETSLDAHLLPALSAAGDLAYVTDDRGALHVLQIRDGALRTSIELGGIASVAPLVADGHVYVSLADGGIVALR